MSQRCSRRDAFPSSPLSDHGTRPTKSTFNIVATYIIRNYNQPHVELAHKLYILCSLLFGFYCKKKMLKLVDPISSTSTYASLVMTAQVLLRLIEMVVT